MPSKGVWCLFALAVLWYTWNKRAGSSTRTEVSSSSQNSECPVTLHSSEDLWVAMPCWDDLPGLRRALRSVMEQQESGYRKIRVVVFEDFSHNMISPEEIEAYRDRMNVTFLRNPEPPNQGSAFGKAKLFDYLRKNALPHEYILVLDGDDVLPDSWAVHDIRVSLQRRKPWFAWGRQNGKFADSCTKVLRDSGLSLRYIQWSFCHPRIFRAHLLNYIDEKDFQRRDGQWLQKATDAAFIYKFMELAGPERVMFLHQRPLYNYTFGHQNGLKVFKKRKIIIDKQNVQSASPAKPLPFDIHVLCLIQNGDDAGQVIKALASSRLNEDQSLHIHVWSNSTSETQLKEPVNRIQKKIPDVKIGLSKMGHRYGAFGWTQFARSIMKKKNVDYFIILDDDQIVSETTIQKLYAKRKPWSLAMLKKKESLDNTENDAETEANCGQFGNCVPARYRKAGLSLVDASIFNCAELFKPRDECRVWTKQRWLFHIVQLHRWKIIKVDPF